MPIPIRILRAEADDLDDPRRIPSRREAERERRIIHHSAILLARHGRHAFTFNNLAIALRMAPMTLRLHFVDLDSLLAEILNRHLQALSAHLGQIPLQDENRQARQRQAYLDYTRFLGAFTPAHLLLVRDRTTLPDDELTIIEKTRTGIAQNLAGDLFEEALVFLDSLCFDAPRIEALLTSFAPEPLPAQPAKARKPAKINLLPTPAATTPPPDPDAPGNWIFTAGLPLNPRPPP